MDGSDLSTTELDLNTANPTDGSRWMVQILSTTELDLNTANPTDGSRWMVQILSTAAASKRILRARE